MEADNCEYWEFLTNDPTETPLKLYEEVVLTFVKKSETLYSYK